MHLEERFIKYKWNRMSNESEYHLLESIFIGANEIYTISDSSYKSYLIQLNNFIYAY